MNEALKRKRLVKLRNILDACFNEEELRTLCFDMMIDYDALSGKEKSAKARELVDFARRHGRILELEEEIRQRRPHLFGSLPSDQLDSTYEVIIREMLKQTDPDYIRYPSMLTYLYGLSNEFVQARSRGDTAPLQAESNRIEKQLEKGTLSALHTPFRKLRTQIEAAREQEISEPSSQITGDPLSLVNLRSQVDAWHPLEEVQEAWTYSDWDKVIRLCNHVINYESNCPDQAAHATAQLYKAGALAQSGQLPKGIRLAERAKGNFSRQGDHCHKILADLLLIRLRREAGQSLDDTHRSYKAIRQRCEELKSNAEEDIEARFFEQIIQEITQTLDRTEQPLANGQCQSCSLDAIPILQLSDRPDMVYQSAKVINYLATDEFKIEGRSYLLYQLDNTKQDALELKAGTTHFALPVPENGWPNPFSKQGQDFALVQAQVSQKGPGFRWTGEKWMAGQFERDVATGDIRFVPRRHIIGEEDIEEERGFIEIEKEATLEEYVSIVGLLSPAKSTELPTGS